MEKKGPANGRQLYGVGYSVLGMRVAVGAGGGAGGLSAARLATCRDNVLPVGNVLATLVGKVEAFCRAAERRRAKKRREEKRQYVQFAGHGRRAGKAWPRPRPGGAEERGAAVCGRRGRCRPCCLFTCLPISHRRATVAPIKAVAYPGAARPELGRATAERRMRLGARQQPAGAEPRPADRMTNWRRSQCQHPPPPSSDSCPGRTPTRRPRGARGWQRND